MGWKCTSTHLTNVLRAGIAALVLAGSAVGASGPEDSSLFAQIAKDGFALTVDGAFFADPQRTRFPNLQPNAGRPNNIHTWSMAWYESALWAGTSDAGCFDVENCKGGQIWRYQPSSPDEGGDWGLSGRWDLVYEPPRVRPLIGLSRGVPADMPRDIGYRVMTTCNAGDGVPRLYVGAFGIPGHILYFDGSSFRQTSNRGLFNGLVDLARLRFDMGYRALACYRGRLWTSPAGHLQDVDTSLHPVVHMNSDPAGGAPWKNVLDVSDPGSHPLADPDNIGIFQAEVVGDYLYLAVVNRTTGAELWRGDGRHCPVPWESDAPCELTWTKIIDNGAGRPPDTPGNPVDNGGMTLGVFGNDLYLGMGDSGVTGFVLAELARVPDAGSPPPGGSGTPHQWELLAGWPRRNFDEPAERLPGLENLRCGNPGDMSDTPPPFWSEAFIELDDDSALDDCLPSTGMGPGMNLDLPDPQWTGLKIGAVAYLWRFAEHQGHVLVGTIDGFAGFTEGDPVGFDLFTSSDGLNWSAVTYDGFGDPSNLGVRTMVSVPDIGLAVGTVSLVGNQVWIGTDAPSKQVPPVPHGGGDQLVFDEDRDESVEVELDGGASVDPFGGGGIAVYEWFDGSLDELGADCANLDANDAFATSASVQVSLPSRLGSRDVVEHRFTLRVTDVDGQSNCDEVRVTASYNLPPAVTVTPSVPFSAGPAIALLDLDGGLVESYDVEGLCGDPEGAVVRCEWVPVDDPGVTLSNVRDTSRRDDLCDGAGPCEVFATVQAPESGLLTQLSGGSGPAMYLEVEDDVGHTARVRWGTDVHTAADTPGFNDPPVCRSLVFHMRIGVDRVLELDPALIDPPACVDPEGGSLTYRIASAPSYGQAAADGTIVYTPDDPDTPAVDSFEYGAQDPAGADALRVAVRVVLDDDDAAPAVAVGFPSGGGLYDDTGCGTPEETICGTAMDSGSGVRLVEVAVRNAAGRYWDPQAGAFVSATDPIWSPAVGGRYWHFPFTPPSNGAYTLMSRAEDLAGLRSVAQEVDFTYASAVSSPRGGRLDRILRRLVLARILSRLVAD